MEKNQRKIKLVLVLPTLYSGGAEKLTVNLLKALDKEIFEPYLICFKEGGYFYEEASQLAEVIVLKKRFKLDILNILQLTKAIKKIKPDVVHSQLGGIFYGALASKLAGVKQHISVVQNVNVSESKFISKLKAWGLRNSAKVIAISQAVKDDAAKRYKYDQNRIQVILNGIDLEEFPANKIKEAGEPFLFGAVGRLTEQKGFSVLLKAISRIKDREFRCFIAGDGHLKDSLEQQIKNLGLVGKVKLVGRRNAYDFYKRLDASVIPSNWEGLGLVALEAGAVNLPIIVSRVDGLKEIIKDKYNGLTFEKGNDRELATKMIFVMNYYNTDRIKGLRHNIRNTVEEKFNIVTIAREYEKVYKKLARHANNPS